MTKVQGAIGVRSSHEYRRVIHVMASKPTLGCESVLQPHIYVCVVRNDSGARIAVTHRIHFFNPDSILNLGVIIS